MGQPPSEYVTGRVITAARILADLSRADLAQGAGIDETALTLMEATPTPGLPANARTDVEAVLAALERKDIQFLMWNDGSLGLRLK